MVVALVEPVLGSNHKVDDIPDTDPHLCMCQTDFDREPLKARQGRWKFGARI